MFYESDSTQLYYVRARWYDPVSRRFISEDPIGLAGGMNPYTFAENDPVNGSDPTGLYRECWRQKQRVTGYGTEVSWFWRCEDREGAPDIPPLGPILPTGSAIKPLAPRLPPGWRIKDRKTIDKTCVWALVNLSADIASDIAFLGGVGIAAKGLQRARALGAIGREVRQSILALPEFYGKYKLEPNFRGLRFAPTPSELGRTAGEATMWAISTSSLTDNILSILPFVGTWQSGKDALSKCKF